MSRKARQLQTPTLDDPRADRARQQLEDAVRELGAGLLAGAKVVTVRLENGIATPIAHGLGRVPVFVTTSLPRCNDFSIVKEIRDGSYPRETHIVVMAANFIGGSTEVEVLFA